MMGEPRLFGPDIPARRAGDSTRTDSQQQMTPRMSPAPGPRPKPSGRGFGIEWSERTTRHPARGFAHLA